MKTKSMFVVSLLTLLPVLMGAECGPEPVDSLCRFDIDCASGQVCDPVQKVCVDPQPSSNTCTLNSGCTFGQYCKLNNGNINDGTCVSAQTLVDDAKQSARSFSSNTAHPMPTNALATVEQVLNSKNGVLSATYSQYDVILRWGNANQYALRIPYSVSGVRLMEDTVGVIPETAVPDSEIWPVTRFYTFGGVVVTGPMGMYLTTLKTNVQNALGSLPTFERERCAEGSSGYLCSVFVVTPKLSEIDYALKIRGNNPALAATLEGYDGFVYGVTHVNTYEIARY